MTTVIAMLGFRKTNNFCSGSILWAVMVLKISHDNELYWIVFRWVFIMIIMINIIINVFALWWSCLFVVGINCKLLSLLVSWICPGIGPGWIVWFLLPNMSCGWLVLAWHFRLHVPVQKDDQAKIYPALLQGCVQQCARSVLFQRFSTR